MVSVVIVAAGKGKRMCADRNKQYLKLKDKEVLGHTLEAFSRIDAIDQIVVVTGADEIKYCRENIIEKYPFGKPIILASGGAERQDSVYNGLMACAPETDIVLIHDGARPFVSRKTICESIEGASKHGACTVAVPAKDTVKTVDGERSIVKTLNREEIYLIQTPQAFRYELIVAAHKRARDTNSSATDDTLLVEKMGVKVRIIDGDYFNIKLTTPEDMIFGNAILEYREKMKKNI